MLSILCEVSIGRLPSTHYYPKYPLRSLLTTVGTGIGGLAIGVKAAKAAGASDPNLGVSLGLLNGMYLGNMASEYIDRKIREHEGSPYTSERTFKDTAKETALRMALGSPVAAALSPANTVVGVMSGHILSGAALRGYGKLMNNRKIDQK